MTLAYRHNGNRPPIHFQDLEEVPGERTIAAHLGMLVDGQHRLQAIVRANQSFIFRRAIYAMQRHLAGRNISGASGTENFHTPRGVNRAVKLKSAA